jgi:protein TonB
MALGQFENRKRALGMAGAVAANALLIAGIFSLSTHVPLREVPATLISIAFTEPPPPRPPPLPDQVEQGAAAPPSRGANKAPSPKPPPRPLATLTPAKVSVDPGSEEASGFGAAAGSGAGQGGEGNGSGSGTGGNGRGSGLVTPPQQVAGALTNADYRAARPPLGAAGTVRVSFRVRSDGAADQCRVMAPSGVPAFDEATCRLIEQRFRFRPALAADGRPVDWTVRTDYTWSPR